ncbi:MULTISPECIES: pseudaminic acid synthase [Butyricimonas]|jgi:pseudaminic acid synthase|uniref:pseudaminic acid synthase n=1 Tax=Butyricimonas TaxID=574697 RepID=UPI0022E2AC86|nr:MULTISPECIES: pseudaminic acid synthase [Butyricimonas]
MNSGKTFIIAELSANHNQDFDLAVKTIEAIAEAGADAVKIQTYKPESLVLNMDNEYFGTIQSGLWKGLRRYDLYKMAATPYEWHPKLQQIAQNLGLVFFSSPFDFEGVDLLVSMHVPIYKIASFEINDIPLIKYVAKQGKPVIMSTGCANIDDINLAIEACKEMGNEQITLLKCTSEYPASYDRANLLTIPDMKKRFGLPVGVSDHTLGSVVPLTAVVLGAEVVEKHFILDRSLGGADSAFSMEPAEFRQMVNDIRNAEASLGQVKYEITEQERLKRRSLYAVEDIKKGDIFTSSNVRSLRPGYGLSPFFYEKLLGKESVRNIKRGEPLTREDLC